jgi:3-methylcrotonyl-CoA carboxylase alpha subunit
VAGIAELLCLGDREEAYWQKGKDNHFSPSWSRLDGFQLGQRRQQTIALLIDDLPTKAMINWDGAKRSIAIDGRSEVVVANSETEFQGIGASEAGNAVYVISDLGLHTTIALPTYDASSLDDGHAGDHVRAPINGKVARIFVAEGQSVTKGDRIAVVEAMKMEHVLHAARDGTIAKVAATEGAQVNQGALIASLAEA